MSTRTAERATLDALLAALIELVASLEHPAPPAVGVALNQVVQLARRLSEQIG